MDLFALTLDIDWAPDFAIERAAEVLVRNNVKATWFVTHDSPAVRNLQRHPGLFELGIHPNFLPDSTHGRTHEEVLTCMRRMLPKAVSMRTHRYHQCSGILSMARNHFDFAIDSSILMPGFSNLRPFSIHYDSGGKELVRLPVFWEDDLEMYNPKKSWRIDHPKHRAQGLKIFNFHPLFIHLNSDSLHRYQELKKKGHFYQMDPSSMEPFVNTGSAGAGTFFRDFCDYIAKNQARHYTLAELVAHWKSNQSSDFVE